MNTYNLDSKSTCILNPHPLVHIESGLAVADPGGCKRGRCTPPPPQLARTYQPSQTSLICQHLVCKRTILQLTHTSINSVWRGLTG